MTGYRTHAETIAQPHPIGAIEAARAAVQGASERGRLPSRGASRIAGSGLLYGVAP